MNLYKLMRLSLVAMLALCVMHTSAWALTASTAYTVEMTKVNSDGTTTLVSTISTTSDANGKITFTFSDVPTQATNNFLIVTVKDGAGAVVIKSFAPAPAANGTNSLGVNTTTTAQAKLMEKLGAVIGTDDPMVIAFGLMFTRNPNIATADIANFAIIGREAIVNGMETYMLANGATAGQLSTFKKKIVYNAAAGTKDLRAFTVLTKSAVDTPAQASADLAKASGIISSIFVDAAAAAGIDLDLVLAAFDSAGIKLGSGPGQAAMNAISPAFRNTMNSAVNTFFTRLAAVKVKNRYSETLTTLNAGAAEKTRFNTGVTNMATALGAADTLCDKYFDGSAGFDITETLAVAFAASRLTNTGAIAALITAGTLATTDSVGTALDQLYGGAFSTFSTDIQSTNGEITTMKGNVATALGVGVGTLPGTLGTYSNFKGATLNWPIPQTEAVNFIASIISAGGSLTYTRLGLAIPVSMQEWFGSCANGTSFSKTACTGAGAVWTAKTATIFNTGNLSFNALLGIQEDIQIAEQTRFEIFFGGAQPSQTVEQTTKQAFIANLATITGNLGGTTNGTVAITTAQKRALVQAQQQPSLE